MTKTAKSWLMCFLMIVLSCALCQASEVSRTAPKLYVQHVAGLLTPIEAVVDRDTSDIEDDDVGGILLIDEEIHYISESGVGISAYHRALKPMNQAGVDSAAKTTRGYLRDIQAPYLVLAHTIRPDGSIEEVAPEATFIQTPQYLANQGIYTDVGELVIVFPDVKPGHIVEYVVVIEQSEPRVPNHFSDVVSFASFWPVSHLNIVYDLPTAIAEKLLISNLGVGIPELKRSHTEPGRERLTWKANARKRLRWEFGREPSSHAGPAVWMTTSTSWNDVASWYCGLTEGREELDEPLKELVDTWTAGLETPDEILDVLFDHVSNDLRYVGLEFGLGALKPRSGPEVWRSQYGDCKDKANLLKAMLGHSGIEAHMVLLDTTHGGRIDQRTPSHRHFNHAIVAVRRDDDLLFCDPTVENSKPGVLPPGDSNRPVLVITDNAGEIVQTPKQSAGTVDFSFDLELTPGGTLKGWFELSAFEYYGAAYAESFVNQDHQSQRESLTSIIQSFFPAAELIDFEKPDVGTPARCFMRAFFIVDGAYREPQSLRQLRLPEGGFVLPDFGDNKVRETRYYQWTEATNIKVEYTLPEGWSLGPNPPSPLKVVAPGLDIDLSWSSKDNRVTGTLLYSAHQNFVDPLSFSRLYQGVSSALSWLAEPVMVGPTDELALPVENAQQQEISLPMMPTAEGQLLLVDHLYPYGGDALKRQAALERVIQLYPDTRETIFDVQLQLAILDYDDDKLVEAISRIVTILANSDPAVDREQNAWARYVLSVIYEDNGDKEKAQALLEAITEEDDLSAERRAWAYFRLASHSDSPEKTFELIDEGLALQDPAPSSDLYALLATTDFVNNGSLVQLTQRLTDLLTDNPQLADAILGSLSESAIDWALGESSEQAVALVEVFEQLQTSHELGFLDETLAPVREILGTQAAFHDIARKIQEFIKKSPPDWWDEAKGKDLYDNLDEHLASLDEFSTGGFYFKWVRCNLELLGTYWNTLDDYGDRLWRLGSVIQANEPQSPLFETTITWCETLPKHEEAYWEGRFLRGKLIQQSNDIEAVTRFYQTVLEDPETPLTYQMAAKISIAKIHEGKSEYDEALKIYAEIEEDRTSNVNAYDGFLRAYHVRIARSEADEAMRLIAIFGELIPADFEILAGSREMQAALKYIDSPEVLQSWWSAYEQWWPQWLELEKVLGIEAHEAQLDIEPIGNLRDFGYAMGVANRENEKQQFYELYRQLAFAARWEPEIVPHITGVNGLLTKMAPQHEDEIRALCIAMNQTVSSTMVAEEMIKNAELQIAIQYTDWGKETEALETVHRYLDRFPSDSSPGMGMVRIWALLATRTGQEQEEAVKALENQLETVDLGSKRGYSVNLLGELYLALGRSGAELALLKNEVDGGLLAPNDGKLEDLKTRLNQLKHEGDESLEFTAAVETWFDAHQPPWFDFAHPADLNDPMISDVETAVTEDDHEFSYLEMIKLRLLVALDSSFALQLRQTAIAKACDSLAALQPLRQQAQKIRDDVINDERFGLSARGTVLWYAAFEAFFQHDKPAVERYTTHELLEYMQASQTSGYETLADLVIDDFYDADQLSEKIETILDDKVDRLKLFVYRNYLSGLFGVGAIDKTEKLGEALKTVHLAKETDVTKTTLRLEFKRGLRDVRDNSATARAMADIVLENYPAPEKRPAELNDFGSGYSNLYNLSRKTAFEIRLWRLNHEVIEPTDYFWTVLAGDFNSYHDDPETLERLVRAAVSGAKDDEDRMRIIRASMNWLDIDDEDTRKIAQEIQAPYRDPEAHPESYAAIRLTEIYTSLRIGDDIHLEEELGNLNHRSVGRARIDWLLRHYTQQKDIPALKRILRHADPEELIKPYRLADTLRAARIAGLKDEIELIEEVAETTMYESILESWANNASFPAERAMKIAEVLYQGPEYPKSWIPHLVDTIDNEETLSRLQMFDAELRKDWEAAAKFASQILTKQPRIYDIYWNLGRAQAKLGLSAEAMTSLTIFTTFANGNVNHPKAVAILDELHLR